MKLFPHLKYAFGTEKAESMLMKHNETIEEVKQIMDVVIYLVEKPMVKVLDEVLSILSQIENKRKSVISKEKANINREMENNIII
jgi:hypothetical protein